MIGTLVCYLPLLALTLLSEGVVVAGLAKLPRRDVLRACIALNLVTHPLATLASWFVPAGLPEIELAVTIFEWVGYTWLLPLSPFAALRYALPANLVSCLLGLFVYFGRLS